MLIALNLSPSPLPSRTQRTLACTVRAAAAAAAALCPPRSTPLCALCAAREGADLRCGASGARAAMRRSSPLPRKRRAVTRAACLLLAALAALAALASLATLAFGPLPALPPNSTCPNGVVLVSNARYLTRGNVGHWGYALFGLHAALAKAKAGPKPKQGQRAAPTELTLFFDARVKRGDWVDSMLLALQRRHGVSIVRALRGYRRCFRADANALFTTFCRRSKPTARGGAHAGKRRLKHGAARLTAAPGPCWTPTRRARCCRGARRRYGRPGATCAASRRRRPRDPPR
jgi:hypothetical protein